MSENTLVAVYDDHTHAFRYLCSCNFDLCGPVIVSNFRFARASTLICSINYIVVFIILGCILLLITLIAIGP